MKSKKEGKKRQKVWLNYHTLPQMKLCVFDILPACASFTTLGTCIKMQASVLMVGYILKVEKYDH